MKNLKIKKILIGVLSVLCVGIIGVFVYISQLPSIKFTSTHTTTEINEEFNTKSVIKEVKNFDENEIKIDASQLNINELGTYIVTYSLEDKTYEIEVEVVDTIAPTFDVKNAETLVGEPLDPIELVENIVDATKTTVQFKEEYQFNEVGKHEMILVVSDEGNNQTEKAVEINIVKDETAPVIKGSKSQKIYVGNSFDPLKDMSVKDDYDENVKLTVTSNKVDASKVGSYAVTYEAIDASGNKATFTKTVDVIQKVVRPSAPVEANGNFVYLTFDDGPSYNTKKIIDILAQYNIKATFFVTGYSSTHRQYITEAFNAGHTIALHTNTHDYGDVYRSVDAYFEDLKEISDLVESLTGYKSPYIRFPGGSSNTVSRNYSSGIMSKLVNEVHNRGYEYYDWNVSSSDASGSSVSTNKIISSSCVSWSGSKMILFHDTYGKDTTVKALPSIIEYYLDRGYTFKAIDDSTPGFHHGVNN